MWENTLRILVVLGESSEGTQLIEPENTARWNIAVPGKKREKCTSEKAALSEVPLRWLREKIQDSFKKERTKKGEFQDLDRRSARFSK